MKETRRITHMSRSQKYYKERMIAKPSHIVKARIIGAGVALGQLAKAAKISQPALSNYVAGRRNDRANQLAIWDAFCHLTGSQITLEEFWGELLAERKAS